MEQLSVHNQDNLNDFYNQVSIIKNQEDKKGTAYFDVFNPKELTYEDKDLYDKFMSNNLTIGEIREYANKIRANGNTSQKNFFAYISNSYQFKRSDGVKSVRSSSGGQTLH